MLAAHNRLPPERIHPGRTQASRKSATDAQINRLALVIDDRCEVVEGLIFLIDGWGSLPAQKPVVRPLRALLSPWLGWCGKARCRAVASADGAIHSGGVEEILAAFTAVYHGFASADLAISICS